MDIQLRCFRFGFDYDLHSSKYNFINTDHTLLLVLSEAKFTIADEKYLASKTIKVSCKILCFFHISMSNLKTFQVSSFEYSSFQVSNFKFQVFNLKRFQVSRYKDTHTERLSDWECAERRTGCLSQWGCHGKIETWNLKTFQVGYLKVELQLFKFQILFDWIQLSSWHYWFLYKFVKILRQWILSSSFATSEPDIFNLTFLVRFDTLDQTLLFLEENRL
jgi:hypothetical protein